MILLELEGVVRDGLIHPSEPIQEYEGKRVKITLESPDPDSAIAADASDEAWQALMDMLDSLKTDMGIVDFADNHDHYIHGTPKRVID